MANQGGAVLTPEAEAALLAEAEAGYDPEELVPRKAAGRPGPEGAAGCVWAEAGTVRCRPLQAGGTSPFSC
ncbi:hypothetical protein GCM10010436_72730 [Paractinoplanes durhamensis]